MTLISSWTTSRTSSSRQSSRHSPPFHTCTGFASLTVWIIRWHFKCWVSTSSSTVSSSRTCWRSTVRRRLRRIVLWITRSRRRWSTTPSQCWTSVIEGAKISSVSAMKNNNYVCGQARQWSWLWRSERSCAPRNFRNDSSLKLRECQGTSWFFRVATGVGCSSTRCCWRKQMNCGMTSTLASRKIRIAWWMRQ